MIKVFGRGKTIFIESYNWKKYYISKVVKVFNFLINYIFKDSTEKYWKYSRGINWRDPNWWSIKQAKCKVSIENCPLAGLTNEVGEWRWEPTNGKWCGHRTLRYSLPQRGESRASKVIGRLQVPSLLKLMLAILISESWIWRLRRCILRGIAH